MTLTHERPNGWFSRDGLLSLPRATTWSITELDLKPFSLLTFKIIYVQYTGGIPLKVPLELRT